jgi:hypothetical protein
MSTILIIVILGLLISFTVGTIVGSLIAFGMGTDQEERDDY